MQGLLVRDYAHAETRIGDLAWRARSHTHYEHSLELTLWERDDELIGWTWLRDNGGCDIQLAGTHRRTVPLWDEMLDRVERQAGDRVRAGDELGRLYTWFADDLEIVEPLLLARSFRRSPQPGGWILVCDDLERAPQPALPPGYSAGWVGDEDVVGRVELHRAAFAPSELTRRAYERVRRTWPYQPELDRTVVSASGEIVAACTAWLDATNHAGLLEPIATHPDHENRGLGRAVVADALRALAAAGATSAQVGTSGPAAQAAYEAAGLRPWKQEVTFVKDLRPEPSEP